MTTVKEYGEYLLNNNIDIELIDYFYKIHSKFYKNVDITFMDYFLEICDQEDEFCIEQNKLQEYGVITNIRSSIDVKRCLDQYNLNENFDYLIRNVADQLSSGTKYSKQYLLTPDAFKNCLIRAKNSYTYSKYYILLEKVFKNFNNYRIEYQKNIIKNISKENQSLHTKIDKQTKDIEDLLKYGKRTSEKLDETNEKLDDMKDELNDVKEELDETNEKLDETAEKLDDLHDKFDDMKDAFEETSNRSVPNAEEEQKRSEFVLLQSRDDPNEFKFMRGIQQYNEVRLNNLYAGEYNIIKREYNANPIQLFNLLKKVVKEELDEAKAEIRGNRAIKNKRQLYKEMVEIKFTSTKLILMNDFTLNDLLRKIKNVADMKFKEYEETTEDAP